MPRKPDEAALNPLANTARRMSVVSFWRGSRDRTAPDRRPRLAVAQETHKGAGNGEPGGTFSL